MPLIPKERIDELLVLKNKRQEDLAKAAGINPKTFSARKKTGKYKEEEIERMASFFKVSEAALLGEQQLTGIADLYQFLAEKTAQQDGMIRVLLSAVGELLAEKRGVPVEEMNQRIIKSVNSESLKNLEKLK